MSDYRINYTLTNESQDGVRFSEWTEDPEDYWWEAIREDGTLDAGRLFRELRAEYGRCQSSVYADQEDGSPKRVGWFFVKRQEYDDYHSTETYLRGAWITIDRVLEPATSELRERVAI